MSLNVRFGIISTVSLLALLIAYPKEGSILSKVGLKSAENLQLRQGLDLKGGAHLVYEADLKDIKQEDRIKAMQSLINVVQERINPAGTSEIVVQTSGSDRVIVELPGVQDVSEASQLIGKTAQLEFFEVPQTATDKSQYIKTGITGNDVKEAIVDFDVSSGEPIVSLRLKTGESTNKFADLTSKLNKSGDLLVTLLDEDVVFGPARVQSPINDGNAQLSGGFDINEAKRISQLINGGALPVPIKLAEQRTVGATLGQESIDKSMVAGLIGIFLVIVFMIIYYRLPGVLASIALLIYAALNIAVFKLSGFTPYGVVLTLAGIAGFILSIGMATDANILIFERMREELRSGKSFTNALELGFNRAWSSIRDSNISTLITCFILFNFGGPIIKGFAVTLGIGVLISMFTAITVTKIFLAFLVSKNIGKNPKWYGLPAGTGTRE